MFGLKFARQQPNRPIAAATLNRPIEEVERLSNMTVQAPLEMHHMSGGDVVRIAEKTGFDARITTAGVAVGSLAAYGWRGIFSDNTSPGTWTDLDSDTSGTATVDPAFERNGNSSLPIGTRILIERDLVSNQLLFSYDQCS